MTTGYVRLSGTDLKKSPDLTSNGLLVGMFFREAPRRWTFGAVMKGVRGRNAKASAMDIQAHAHELVYPANAKWSKTQEQETLAQQGRFAEARMYEPGTAKMRISNFSTLSRRLSKRLPRRPEDLLQRLQ